VTAIFSRESVLITSPCPRGGRRKPRETRCRRVGCNARQRNNAGSSNRNPRQWVRLLTAAQLAHLLCPALHPTRRAPSARADLPSDKGRLRTGSGHYPMGIATTQWMTATSPCGSVLITSPCPRGGRRKPRSGVAGWGATLDSATTLARLIAIPRQWVRRVTAAQLAHLLCPALHPTRRAPSARADLPSDNGRLGKE
jgi:hypothetical protein